MDTLQRRALEKQKKLEEQQQIEQLNAYNVVLSYLLDEGFASTEDAADKIILNMSESWFENIMELNRLEKEQGKESGGSSDEAYRSVKRTIRGMEGKPLGQRKKEKGKKPPEAGEYGSERRSPEQIVKKRREDKKRGEEMMHSARD
jgi:hypothetical protein